MPKVKNARLTLPRDGANVAINITYDAVFSEFERRLVGLGLKFQEQITLIGVDPSGGTTGSNVFTVLRSIPVSNGAGETSVPRIFSTHSSRNSLDEDPSPLGPDFDADEYRGRIRIMAIGLPAAVTPDAFTDQQTLGGGITQPAIAAKA